MAPGAGKKRERSDEPQEEQQPAKRATLEASQTVLLISVSGAKLGLGQS